VKGEAIRDIDRALELHAKGYSPATISATIHVPQELVQTILKHAAAITDAHEEEPGGGG
jgi:orotate phosphoribosyltransferase-like protein